MMGFLYDTLYGAISMYGFEPKTALIHDSELGGGLGHEISTKIDPKTALRWLRNPGGVSDQESGWKSTRKQAQNLTSKLGSKLGRNLARNSVKILIENYASSGSKKICSVRERK
jgi:hypothetical protein